MTQSPLVAVRGDHLRRLAPEFYRGQAYVHWSMTLHDRKTGWLVPIFYYKFRELLTHALFRYGLCCPIYCCMPDHFHLLWVGILRGSDQLAAMKYLRKQLNPILATFAARLQREAYDHVLREEERNQSAFEDVVEYIARNPERAGLVGPGRYQAYPYTGCLLPGYPDLRLWQQDYWRRFWRCYSYLRDHGLVATGRPEEEQE